MGGARAGAMSGGPRDQSAAPFRFTRPANGNAAENSPQVGREEEFLRISAFLIVCQVAF